MERFYYEIPTIKRKAEAIDYIQEHLDAGSKINGSGSLDKYYQDYEKWLEKLEVDYNTIPSEERVPSKTYFLIRESDDKLVGMINIRLTLNSRLSKDGGHIGYGIRPSERRKGYNKVNLYMGLKVLDEHGVDIAFLDANINNEGSWKTMEALGGYRVKERYDEEDNCTMVDYNFDVKKSLEEYKEVYGAQVVDNYIR